MFPKVILITLVKYHLVALLSSPIFSVHNEISLDACTWKSVAETVFEAKLRELYARCIEAKEDIPKFIVFRHSLYVSTWSVNVDC